MAQAMPSFFDFKHSSNWDGDIRSPAKSRTLASAKLQTLLRLLNSETGIRPNSSSSTLVLNGQTSILMLIPDH